jgi:hypothetical protein
MNKQRIKISSNFNLDEFIPKEFYISLERLVNIAQFIREKTGESVTINNWYNGGTLNNRGFRMPNSTVGAPASQHKIMNAIDINIGRWTAAQMLQFIKNNSKELYNLGVRRIEDIKLTPTWLHIDCREHNEKCINIIDLTKVVEKIPV